MFERPSPSLFFLRTGLGIVFLWIGIDVFRAPDAWIGYMPDVTLFGLDRASILPMGGVFDMVLGALLIAGLFPRIVAGLGIAHLLYVLITFGVDAVLIRDVGLLGALLSLFFWKKAVK